MFFKDYISYDMQYMYFDFKDVTDFREILYQILFDRLFIENSYKIKGYQYDQYDEKTEDPPDKPKEYDIILELNHSETTDFRPALIFYRLLLNSPNNKYYQIDLKKPSTSDNFEEPLTSTESATTRNYLYDDNKVVNCQKGYFYNKDESTKCIIFD